MSVYTDLHNHIMALFSEKLIVEVPDIETDLVESGILDSLTFVDLLVHLEQEFEITVSLDTLDFDNFQSVAKIAEFVAANNGKF